MCGICGYVDVERPRAVKRDILEQMIGAIRHRGPDEFGLYLDQQAGLGHARLSIIDLSCGQQPMGTSDQDYWVVFNGEIFNYIELKEELVAAGHTFETTSDTEVLLHAYLEWGPNCVDHFIGQFAFALWDRPKRELFLARDRVGIRPLYYAWIGSTFLFASEMKCLLLHPQIRRDIDPTGLGQVFTFWSTLAPRTPFKDIYELPAGHSLQVRGQAVSEPQPYWQLRFPTEPIVDRGMDFYRQKAHELLVDATRLRLRSDVPVGAYLSGGLDSSATTSIILNHTNSPLETFSVTFTHPDYDESSYQHQMADYLGTRHHTVPCDNPDIGQIFPQVVWHAEKPLLRTAPAPLYILSRLVYDNHIKVVMTGEGADEIFGGYNIFREDKVRRFWARHPESAWRPLLLKRLYPYLLKEPTRAYTFLKNFFKNGLTDTDSPCYSHHIRWNNARRLQGPFFTPGLKEQIQAEAILEDFRKTLPTDFMKWTPLARAQFIEIQTFLSSYLISSQGDRMLAGNSVEGRFPFLDHRLIELTTEIPSYYKIRGLDEKYLLKKMFSGKLPDNIVHRDKQPYRAPVYKSFFYPDAPEYVAEMLSDDVTRRYGFFTPEAVEKLATKCANSFARGIDLSASDDMALVAILSTHLLYHQFVEQAPHAPDITANLRVIDLSGEAG